MTKNITSWKPGQSGNPRGRPKGSRDVLTESFIKDLHRTWKEHGPEVLERVARDQPTELCKLVARLLPKDATLKVEDSRSPFLILLEAMNGRGDPHLVKAIQERRAVKTIESKKTSSGSLLHSSRGSGKFS